MAMATPRSLHNFKPSSVLQFSVDGGRHAVVQGRFGEESAEAVITLDQKGGWGTKEKLLEALPTLTLTLTNDSGAEYSFYDSTSACGLEYAIEIICPASTKQIQRKMQEEMVLAEETAAVYESVVRPYALEQVKSLGWVENVVSLAKERERNLFNSEAFVVNVDTKWTSHAPMTEGQDRTQWRGAHWVESIYLLAIVKDPSLTSLRELRGEAGAALCDSMASELRRQAWEVYGVPAGKLRIFFHYSPQFYRLHAHCTSLSVSPGCEAERAHLLSTVSFNLRLDPDYYAKANLLYKVRVGEALHSLLEKAQALL